MTNKTTLTQIQYNVLCAENISTEYRVWAGIIIVYGYNEYGTTNRIRHFFKKFFLTFCGQTIGQEYRKKKNLNFEQNENTHYVIGKQIGR